MILELSEMKPKGLRERIDRALVKGVIGTKSKPGLGNKKSLKGSNEHPQSSSWTL